MKKQLTIFVMTILFLGGIVATGLAQSLICEVKSVDGTSVVLDCGKKVKKISVGDKVKIKVKKVNSQAIEGC